MDVNENSRVPKKRWLWGCVSILALCATVAYIQWFLWGYVPLSTLPVVVVHSEEIDKICTDTRFSLPYYSPDGKYYIDIDFSRHRDARVLILFESDSHQLLGTHSYYFVDVECWAQDGTAIYVTDDVPRSIGVLDLDFLTPGITERKILVPCRSSLAGVSLLPRLYWEMRCAFSDPHSWIAVWLPLVVVLIGLAVVVGISIWMMLWLWRRVLSWWYGE